MSRTHKKTTHTSATQGNKPAPATPATSSVSTAVAAKTPLMHLIRFVPWILIVGGVISIIASAVITQEKFTLASNPHYQPVCDLNPIISCGSVMKSAQAHAFGFMNPYIGLIGFPIVVTIGVGMLAGARYKRWFWLGAQIGLTFGVAFAYWLLWQSMYRIRALCPWCLTIDVAITTIFWYLTIYNFHSGNLALPQKYRMPWLVATGRFINRHHVDILVFWFLVVIAAILQHFWYYFGHHL